MTALVFALQPDQVCIVMDTLVVAADDKQPLGFARKFLSRPDIDLLVAGTGQADIVLSWFQLVQNSADLQGIDQLNDLAPTALRKLSSLIAAPGSITTTLYHFGYSVSEQQYVGYAYRSTKDWSSDRLPYALGFKPTVPIPPTDDIQFPEFMIEVMLRQQSHDRSSPLAERVGIGGEIEFVVMSERQVSVQTVHQFESFADEQRIVASRVGAS